MRPPRLPTEDEPVAISPGKNGDFHHGKWWFQPEFTGKLPETIWRFHHEHWGFTSRSNQWMDWTECLQDTVDLTHGDVLIANNHIVGFSRENQKSETSPRKMGIKGWSYLQCRRRFFRAIPDLTCLYQVVKQEKYRPMNLTKHQTLGCSTKWGLNKNNFCKFWSTVLPAPKWWKPDVAYTCSSTHRSLLGFHPPEELSDSSRKSSRALAIFLGLGDPVWSQCLIFMFPLNVGHNLGTFRLSAVLRPTRSNLISRIADILPSGW